MDIEFTDLRNPEVLHFNYNKRKTKMADYHQIKNAAILTPTGSTDLGSDSNRYSNVFMSGNIVMSNGVTVTSTNVITPKIASVTYPGNDTAADIAGGQTLTITGSGFSSGATVLIGGSPVAITTVVSGTSITFISPASSAGNYALYVVNSDGGTAIYIPGVAYSGTPIWSTTAGSLATVYETTSISNTVTATGDATISYSLTSGALPTNSTLNSSTGLISGTAPASAGSTTYAFTIRATDAQNQDTDRSFTITVNTDSVTWNSPADNTATALEVDSAMSTVTLSATSAAGKSITYTANALPTGVSISTNTIVGTPTVAGSVTSLITATAATTGRTATRTLSWVVSVASDTYFKNTTLLLSGNGTNNLQNNTFLDGSTNNFTITRNGNTTQGTFSPYGANWSLYTNGTNSYAYVPYSATRSIGTGDFSIECWVYIARQPANYTRVWSHQSNWGLAGSIGVELAFSTVDTLIQTLVDGNSTTYTSATYDTSGTNGSGHVRQWIHVVSSRQNGYLRLFVNGVLREASASTTNINGTSTTSFGTNSQLGGDLTELYISNFRMCIGSVPTLYSTTSTTAGTTIFTPSTIPLTTISQGAAGVQLLLFQDNRIIERSNNVAVTTVNNPSIQRFSPFGLSEAYSTGTFGGSGYFDGSSYLNISTTSSTLDFGTGDFTIEMWVNPATQTTSFPSIISCASAWASGAFYIRYSNYLAANKFGIYWNSVGDPFLVSSSTYSENTWHHVAVTRSGSTVTLWVNGSSAGTGTSSASLNLALGSGVWIGNNASASCNYKGYVSNVRVVKGTAVYTSTFTPSTIPFTAITNTSLLINFTNAGIIDNTMINNLETVGDAKISTTQSKFGGSSMYFDGTGDYCFLPNTHSFLFSKGDFTIEAWVYINDTSTRKYILGPGTDTASHFKGFGLEIWGQQLSMWASSNGTGWDILECDTSGNRGATLLAINTWYHIAVSRSGSTFRSFVNGVVEKTFTSSATIFSDVTIPYNIGRSGYSPGGYFYYNGYMDDLRITRGYARYTGTFTPPTSAFLVR
jgi:hypothetical protein